MVFVHGHHRSVEGMEFSESALLALRLSIADSVLLALHHAYFRHFVLICAFFLPSSPAAQTLRHCPFCLSFHLDLFASSTQISDSVSQSAGDPILSSSLSPTGAKSWVSRPLTLFQSRILRFIILRLPLGAEVRFSRPRECIWIK